MLFTLTCSNCNTQFTRKKPQQPGWNAYCSAECQRLGQEYKTGPAFSKAGPYSGIHVCPNCNDEFSPHHPAVVYCSKRCQTQAANARTAKRYRDRAVVGGEYSALDRKVYKAALLDTIKNCSICKTDFSTIALKQIHVDHCHRTGKVRGLLCSNCNQGLGNFKDDVERLEAAIKYLNEWNKR